MIATKNSIEPQSGEPLPNSTRVYAPGKMHPEVRKGYARIERAWKKGDAIELALPMPVRRIVSRPEVTTSRGRIALQRGPLVYCLEGPDNDGKVLDLVIGEDAAPAAEFRPDLLGGVVAITGKARTVKRTLQGGLVPDAERTFTAIPYYAWAHRGRAHMTVWPAGVPEAARPKPADTLAAVSKTTASYVHVSLDAIKDQNTPESSADSSSLQLDFWSHKGTTEWLQFEWDAPRELSRVKVYWFDDTGRGECRVPASWRVLAKDAAGEFRPVENRGPCEVAKDVFNTGKRRLLCTPDVAAVIMHESAFHMPNNGLASIGANIDEGHEVTIIDLIRKRRRVRRYRRSREEVLRRYGDCICQVGSVPGVFSSALGDEGYIFRAPDLETIQAVTAFIQAPAQGPAHAFAAGDLRGPRQPSGPCGPCASASFFAFLAFATT